MHIPSPTADQNLAGAGLARTVLYVAPVAAIALYGALWIALHAGGGRGSTHTMFQSLTSRMVAGPVPASAIWLPPPSSATRLPAFAAAGQTVSQGDLDDS